MASSGIRSESRRPGSSALRSRKSRTRLLQDGESLTLGCPRSDVFRQYVQVQSSIRPQIVPSSSVNILSSDYKIRICDVSSSPDDAENIFTNKDVKNSIAGKQGDTVDHLNLYRWRETTFGDPGYEVLTQAPQTPSESSQAPLVPSLRMEPTFLILPFSGRSDKA